MSRKAEKNGLVIGFGPYLAQALQKRGMSASEAARRLGYKSRNSIFRVLDESGGYAALETCYQKIAKTRALGLTDEEFRHLGIELEVSRVGMNNFLSNRAMRCMLRENERAMEPIRWRMGGELFGCIAQSRRAEITLLGVCSRSLMQALSLALPRGEGTGVRIIHYLYTGGEEVIEAISAIQPLLYARCYTAYGLEPGSLPQQAERALRCGRMLARLEDGQGRWRTFDATQVAPDLLAVSELREGAKPTALEYMLEESLPRLFALKVPSVDTRTPQDYLEFTRQYAEMERGRAIYTIKLDVPINFIHPDLLISSVREGFRETGFVREEERETLISEFAQIQLARWDNFFTKRRPTHTIFSLPAMEQFARTGKQSDHFFAMRPYTPMERAAILCHIRTKCAENSSFKVYFFKEDYQPPRTEITLYEGIGTLMSKPDTNYNLAGDHAEALITQPEFCRKYKEFFTQDLLANQVRSDAETLELLERLERIALEG